MEQSNTTAEKPWYKHGWLWFIIAIPLVSVIVGIGLGITAIIHQDAVVRDDWYKDGKAINQNLSRDKKAKELGLAGELRFDATTGQINLALTHKSPLTMPEKLTLVFSHATQSGKDQRVIVKGDNGLYQGFLNNALQGPYSIEIGTQEWRLLESATLPNPTVSLGM